MLKGHGNGSTDPAQKIDWKKNLLNNWPWIVLAIISIFTSTLLLNFLLDGNVIKSGIYWIAMISIVAIIVIALYQDKKNTKVLINVYKTQLIVILLLLPLITGIFGYNWKHYVSSKNERMQKNEFVKIERDRRQGMEAEIIKDFKVDNREFKRGEILPLVLANNSVQEEQRGPYKFIEVYTSEKETAWISLENAVLMPKTLHYEGYDKRESLDGKTWTIIFNTDQLVKVVDNFPIGQKFIVTGSAAGELKVPYVSDSTKFMDEMLGVILTNQKANSLCYKYKVGGKITIKLL
ncbi:MAG: hypothetical protein WCL13_01030 [bacterium]